MSIKLTCGDGVSVRVQREHFEKSVFTNPDISAARSYTLQCKATSEIVNAIVDMAEGESETVTITGDNFEELQSLCEELGFRGLDKELQAFKASGFILVEERLDEYEEKLENFETELVDMRDSLKEQVEDHGFSLAKLKEQIKKHEQLFQEVQRRLSELETEKTESRVVSGQIPSLERKVEEIARVCEERNVEVSRRTEQALRECAKQHDLEELLSWKRKTETEVRETMSRQFQSLERRVEEVARVCEKRNVEKSRKTNQALRECAKQRDLEELARDLLRLKQTAMQRPREFVYDSSKPLEGIIADLTRECGGNVHDKGIVNVTASSVKDSSYQPKNAADLGTYSCYCSKPTPWSWICYDFKERRVIPTSYSVRSHESSHLRSWVVEVSNDGYSWTEIDRRNHNNDLNARSATANFKIFKVPSESFRFFRLASTGMNHNGNYYVMITSLEIFGTLFEK